MLTGFAAELYFLGDVSSSLFQTSHCVLDVINCIFNDQVFCFCSDYSFILGVLK